MDTSVSALLEESPVVAVLRGIAPEEAVACGEALVDAGVCVLEVTLDSPQPFESLKRLTGRFGDRALIAAGTVLEAGAVPEAAAAGARMIVAPNFSAAVVEATRHAGLISAPGVMTPSEAFAALGAGAHLLKLFPGDVIGPGGVKALRAVLPGTAPLMVTGGVSLSTVADFLDAGAIAVGIGSALFKPGIEPAELASRAQAFAAAAREARA